MPSDAGELTGCHPNKTVTTILIYSFSNRATQVNFLLQASSALIVAKRLEIQHSRKKKTG